MNKEILIESMTKIFLPPDYHIRVWREEPKDSDIKSSQLELKRAVNDIIVFKNPVLSFYKLAEFILKIDRVNAVEVIDYDGEGIILYSGWP